MLTTEAAGVMQWTMRLEMRTSAGELKTTELVTFSRPAVIGTLAEVGLLLDKTKTLLARLQASMLCGQVADYAAHYRAQGLRMRFHVGFAQSSSAIQPGA